ncbi:hypothetical protein AAW51_0446 [Caldimonas brevitalea]|uniref:Uncharacterized protein n=1 Tax=Caldimonas brevitalea TaxID=413882 RepID=A0A0G3BCT1_9BURK|nr:hypothetical protein AAW51_0446 [Caldimonas brevitalea]
MRRTGDPLSLTQSHLCPASVDVFLTFQRGQRPVERLVREPDVLGQVLERALAFPQALRVARQRQVLQEIAIITMEATLGTM